MATASKKLLNAEDAVVEQMICGLLACHPTLTRLEGTHVLLRADFQETKASQVTLLSGGVALGTSQATAAGSGTAC